MNKQNCYKCKHKGDIPGDAHICCNHPLVNNEIDKCSALLNSLFKNEEFYFEPLKIKANEHGISKGWFNWPINFDHVWLENCDGFEEQE